MVNLCVGIIGGIFSSIIVSRVFLIQSVHSEQVVRIQKHFETMEELQGGFLFYPTTNIYGPSEDPDAILKLNERFLEQIKKIAEIECNSFVSMIFDDLETELHEISSDLFDYVLDLHNLKTIDQEKIEVLDNELTELKKRFDEYKNNNAKIFRKRMINDKALRILFSVLIIIIVITLIA